MIEAQGLTKRFGERSALSGMSFDVEEGRIHGLLGPNGAGKTTTTRILAGLLTPDQGRARVAGFDVIAEPARVRASVGILTEVPGLYDRLNADEYLDFFGQMYGLAGQKRHARIEELLRLLGLWEHRGQRLRTFSKGMKQKVAIARTLLHQPRVLFFDEPTAALDPESAKTVRDHLVDLIQHERCTVLLCTHNLAEAERICHRLSIVQFGRAIAEGTPEELKAGMTQSVWLTLSSPRPDLLEVVRLTPGVSDVEQRGQTITYRATDVGRVNPQVVARVVSGGGEVVALTAEAVALEDAYLQLMQRTAN